MSPSPATVHLLQEHCTFLRVAIRPFACQHYRQCQHDLPELPTYARPQRYQMGGVIITVACHVHMDMDRRQPIHLWLKDVDVDIRCPNIRPHQVDYLVKAGFTVEYLSWWIQRALVVWWNFTAQSKNYVATRTVLRMCWDRCCICSRCHGITTVKTIYGLAHIRTCRKSVRTFFMSVRRLCTTSVYSHFTHPYIAISYPYIVKSVCSRMHIRIL